MPTLRENFREDLDRAAGERADQERRRRARQPVNNGLQIASTAAPAVGAFGGAALGGALGSIIPGAGTLAGASLGAGLGGAAGTALGGITELFRGQMGAEDERAQIEDQNSRAALLQMLGQMR